MDRIGLMNRRTFLAGTGLLTLSGVSPSLMRGQQSNVSAGKVRLTIVTDGPARVEVRGPRGEMYHPEGALMDQTANQFTEKEAEYYLGHSTSTGTATLEAPAGRYTVIVEKGLEFQRVESVVDLMSDQIVQLAPQRWANMVAKGWWSGDFHLHRPPDDAKRLLMAEDLNFGVFFTMWNKKNLWENKKLPLDPAVRVDATHIYSVNNAEDERGGGVWLMHNVLRPLALAGRSIGIRPASASLIRRRPKAPGLTPKSPFGGNSQ